MHGKIERLVLVRHGKPENYGPDGTDASRRLTPEGVAELERRFSCELAPRLGSEKSIHIWSSPAVRARQTAELAASSLGIASDAIEECKALYAQDDVEFMAELEAMGDGTVIAVGHIPFMDRFCWSLTGQDVLFRQGTVCCIEFAGGELQHGGVAWTLGA